MDFDISSKNDSNFISNLLYKPNLYILSELSNWNILLLTLLTCFVSVQTIIKIRERQKFPNRVKVPQPFSLPLIGPVLQIIWPGTDHFKLMVTWCEKFGKIFQATVLFQKTYILVDPEYIQKLLLSPSPDHVNKPKFTYSAILGGNVPDGLLCSDYAVWKPHRRLLTRSLALQQIMLKLNFQAKNLIKKLLTDVDDNEVFTTPSVPDRINVAGLEFMLHIIMDSEIMSPEESEEFHRNIYEMKQISGRRITEPWLLLKPIWWLHPVSWKNRRISNEVRKFVNIITERYRQKRRDTAAAQSFPITEVDQSDEIGMRKFKCLMEELLEGGLGNEEIFQEVLTMVAGGYETTIWSTCFLLMRLATNPECQEKCRSEIDELFRRKEQENGWKNSLDGDLSMNDLNSLEYLDRCVKESLRLLPVVAIFSRRLDTELKLEENLVLERGAEVIVAPYAVHRNQKSFPDPEKFDPDRFLPEECKKRHPYAYIPFSGGMRNCAGWKVALLTNKILAAMILRNFYLETTQKWEDVKILFEITLTAEEINLTLKPRDK